MTPTARDLPNLLVIGAMKSGTTSLWADLAEHPEIEMSSEKEPASLVHDAVLTPAGLSDYRRRLRFPGRSRLRGEASTDYTKLPDITGVPARARQVLGDDVRLVYIVRDPVRRAVSHYGHELAREQVSEDVDHELLAQPRFVDWSRYAYQWDAWADAFGPEAIRVVGFETYLRDRDATLAELALFLGVSPSGFAETAVVRNRAAEGGPIGRRWHRVRDNATYRRVVRPLLPTRVRERLVRAAQEPGIERPEPSPATVAELAARLRPFDAEIAQRAGWDACPWDLADYDLGDG